MADSTETWRDSLIEITVDDDTSPETLSVRITKAASGRIIHQFETTDDRETALRKARLWIDENGVNA